MDGIERRATEALALAVALGVALAPFTYGAVTVLRGIVTRRRRLVLPVAGIACGVAFGALVLLVLGAPFGPGEAALVILAGFWSQIVSAGLHSHGRESRRE